MDLNVYNDNVAAHLPLAKLLYSVLLLRGRLVPSPLRPTTTVLYFIRIYSDVLIMAESSAATKAHQRLAQLRNTLAPTPTEDAPVKQTRASIAARMARDPGLPVPSPTLSYWQDPEHSFAHIRSPTLPSSTDVVLIGSGLTAVSTATHLLRLSPSLRIVILEARAAISGATGRNGGHIKASPWADYHDLKELFGKESGMKIIRFRMAHLDVFCEEAAKMGEEGKRGLVRRTKALSTSYSKKAWEGSKMRLKVFLEDFPEEKGKWEAIEDRETLRVCGLQSRGVNC
jgi:hypothetical protein